MKRTIRILVLAAAAFLAAACSLTHLAYMNATLAYSNATPLLAWSVGDYVDMTDPQKDWMRERLARAMAWHRAEELPAYRRFLESVAARAEDGISADEAREAHRALRAHYHRALDHVLPDLAEFLAQLDPEQAQQLERRFADDNRKIAREAAKGTPEERRDDRVGKYRDHIEEFTGRLTDAQRALVAERIGAFADLTEDRLEDRRYRQKAIVALVRDKASREQMIPELRRLLIDTETWRRPDYLRKLRVRDEQMFEMVAALSATLSPEQRVNVQKRLRGFMRDITDLTTAN